MDLAKRNVLIVGGTSGIGLGRARSRAANGGPRLLDAITQTGLRWFAQDQDYPGGWEPSGFDFLSPALTEADVLAHLQAPDEFADWLHHFLPSIAERQPAALFEPGSTCAIHRTTSTYWTPATTRRRLLRHG